MVAPKFKAVAITENRKEIEEAIFEIGRLTPNQEKIMLLINLFNEVHGTYIFTYHKYAGCGDCQRNLKNFWLYVIKEWKKQ
jgi:hypothetical protein